MYGGPLVDCFAVAVDVAALLHHKMGVVTLVSDRVSRQRAARMLPEVDTD